MTYQSFIRTGLLVLAVVGLLFPGKVQAQETPPQLNNLLVEIWPEYDRPEVLVIYRGELNPATSFPVRLTFRLPGYVEDMHAVAVEENGALLNVDRASIELQRQDNELLFSFPVSAPKFQFEYYDSQILTRQGPERRLTYRFLTPYAASRVTFEVQEPLEAQNFSLTPPVSRTVTGQNGLNYAIVEKNNLAAGDTVELSATYSRATDEVSISNLPDNNTGAPGVSVVSEAPVNDNPNLGYWLVGIGAVLLVGTAGYWLWSRRQEVGTALRTAGGTSLPSRRRTPGRRRDRTGQKGVRPGDQPAGPVAAQGGSFCYRCGTALRPDAEFCHACGAPRRRT